MSKRDRKLAKAGATPMTDDTSVAKDVVVDAESNSKLADFAKQKAVKDAAAAAAAPPKSHKLPPLPRKAGASKPLVDCACGCGMQTRSKFYPGHDSRLKGWALRIARNVLTLDDIVNKYERPVTERDAVAAYIRQLKKEGKYEDLKLPQQVVAAKKAASE